MQRESLKGFWFVLLGVILKIFHFEIDCYTQTHSQAHTHAKNNTN